MGRYDTWLRGLDEVKALERLLQDDVLRIIAGGAKGDPAL
jgi:hypothetical protein